MKTNSTEARLPTILMCSPEYYGIEYEINPWMNETRQVDHDLALRQWNDLKTLLESLGAKLEFVQPQRGLPDLVFTANAALLYRDRAILSRFRHPQRQGEEPYFADRLSQLGFDVEWMPDDQFLEGAGDALFCGDTLFAGYRIRSTANSLQRVAERLECEVLPLELVDRRFYHLDTCFCPLTVDTAIWYPPAFDDYGRSVITSRIPHLSALDDSEALAFGANAVVLGKSVVTNTGCTQLHDALRGAGFDPYETPLSEFLKAGGSAKCLTLRLDGEDAAGWKYVPDSPEFTNPT